MLLRTLTTPRSGVSCLRSFHSATNKGWSSCDHRLGRWIGFTAVFSENFCKRPRLHFQKQWTLSPKENLWLQGGNPIPTHWPGFPEAVAFDPKGIGHGQAVLCNACWTWSNWRWDPSGWLCFTLENHTPKNYYFLILLGLVQVFKGRVSVTALGGGLFQPTNSILGICPRLEHRRFIGQPIWSMFESSS